METTESLAQAFEPAQSYPFALRALADGTLDGDLSLVCVATVALYTGAVGRSVGNGK